MFTVPPGCNKKLPLLLVEPMLKTELSFESHLTNILLDTSVTRNAHSWE